jgi:prolyl-tRNA synthetase
VGNVFDLGQKYPKAFNFTYKAQDGTDHYPIVGCFGIGTTRLMGTVVEVFADDKGIVWPEAIAPFRVHLVQLGMDAEVIGEATEMYRELTEAGVEVLWDDRDLRAGEKFADSDLYGIPLRVVVSQKSLAAGSFECVERKGGTTNNRSLSELLEYLRND